MKKKMMSLAMAAALMLSAAGCSAKTPASVGKVGEVEIPAGLYLMAQYNAFQTAANAAELGEGEKTTDVKAVLKAQCTGTIGGEEVTASGEEYIKMLTLRTVQYYAAVETMFNEMNGELGEQELSTVASRVESLWSSNGDAFTANGIGRSAVEAYVTNAAKAGVVEQMLYGEGGSEEISEADYAEYIQNDCYLLDTVMLPLYDANNFMVADEEKTADIEKLAENCAAALSESTSVETEASEVYSAMVSAAAEYLPQVYEVLGAADSFDASTAGSYVGSDLYTMDDLASYNTEDGGNQLLDVVDKLDEGEWGTVKLGMNVLVVRRADALAQYSAAKLAQYYGLMDAMKGNELQERFYADGAALAQDLDQKAMSTYKAANIKAG